MKIKPDIGYHILVYQIKDYDGLGLGIFKGHTRGDVENDSVLYLCDSRNILSKTIAKYKSHSNKKDCNNLIQNNLTNQDQ